MNQVLAFGKRYGKWIAAGVVASVVAVGSVIAYKSYAIEDDDYSESGVEPEETEASEQTETV